MKTIIIYDSSDSQALKVREVLSRVCLVGSTSLESIDVSKEKLKSCIGCFGCWVRTPGICVHTKDFGTAFLSKIFDADQILILSHITWGGYSPGIKAYTDRLLPLLHPYFTKRNGEMHHKLRYRSMPVLHAVGFNARTTEEEQTFVRYADAHRDNMDSGNGTGTFIWKTENSEEAQAAACAAWYLKESAQ